MTQDASLAEAVAAAKSRFMEANPRSHERFIAACKAMPGGNTRSALHYEPFPLTMVRGDGAWLEDYDGHRYLDFIGDYTASLFGHSHPKIRETLHATLDEGLTLGAPNTAEAELAALICNRFPSVDRLRFTNSGTEANLMSVTAACEHTGRDAILVFDSGYHGGVLSFAGNTARNNAPYPFVIGQYNDIDNTAQLIDTEADRLAAILIEPMMGTGGAIPARREFLEMLRERSTHHDIVLIFDEVMTSRMSSGGLQLLTGVTPDMTSFGKYLGGGGTFGAFGGRADIMDRFDPRRVDGIFHAGTFNNNVMTMAGGLVGLRDVFTAEVADAHTRRGDEFRETLNSICDRRDVPLHASGVGSIAHLHWQREPVLSPADVRPANPDLRVLLHLKLIERGLFLSQKGFITLSLPLTDSDYGAFLSAFDESLEEMAPFINQAKF